VPQAQTREPSRRAMADKRNNYAWSIRPFEISYSGIWATHQRSPHRVSSADCGIHPGL